MRVVEGAYEGNNVGIEKTWKPYNEISPHFFRAVIVAKTESSCGTTVSMESNENAKNSMSE
jgi:hypothetical protein